MRRREAVRAAAGWDRAFTAAAALEEARLESPGEMPPRARAPRPRPGRRPACDAGLSLTAALLLRRAGRADAALAHASAALLVRPARSLAARERRLAREAGARAADAATDAAERPP